MAWKRVLPKNASTPAHRSQRQVAGVWLPAINAFFAGVRFEMGNDGWHSFLALNDESASVDASFDFTPVWNSMPAGASFCVAVPYSHGIAEEMLSHISQENDKLNGALDGGAGLCWYEDSKLQTPLFVGQFDGTAEQAQLPGKLFTQNIGAHESKAPEGVLPVSQTQQGEAQIWRREVSSRYGQYPKAQAAQPDQLMSDYFFRVSLAMQNKRCFSPSMTRWLITPCKH